LSCIPPLYNDPSGIFYIQACGMSVKHEVPIRVKVEYMPRSKRGVPLMEKPISFIGVVLFPSVYPGRYVVRGDGTACYDIPINDMDEI